METEIGAQLRSFICANYLFGDESRVPGDHDSLVETGIVDSTGVLELIEFLEDRYRIEVCETETIPQNLDSISNLTRFVLGKLRALSVGGGSPALRRG